MKRQITFSRQRGVALIIGMVLLLAITILAVAGMHGARSELLMSGMSQRLQQVQNAAESGVELRFADGANFQTTWLNATPFADVSMGPRNEILIATTGRYIGASAPPPGYSLNGQFTAHHFEISSNAAGNPNWDNAAANADPMLGAAATQAQGFFIIGPGN